MNERILITEDNQEIAEAIEVYLISTGYEVVCVENGKEAMGKLGEVSFDLAIIDLIMPEMDGFQLIEEIRRVSDMPIIIISGREGDYHKVKGLNLGADDYITKPFSPPELIARVNSSMRRWRLLNEVRNKKVEELRLGEITMNLNDFRVFKREEEILLTLKEFKILRSLMESPNRILSKKQLTENVNGFNYENDERVITVHISHIREKIGQNSKGESFIKTVRGLGYKIEC